MQQLSLKKYAINAYIKVISMLTVLTLFFSCLSSHKHHWQQNSDLFGTWLNLERDETGYLIYDPCDGDNNYISINNSFVIYSLGQEGPDTLNLSTIKILESPDEIEFLATNDYYSVNSVLKIIDFDKKLHLLKWELTPKNNPQNTRKGKMMMTKKEYEKEFRFIDNPCDDERIPEKEFLTVEYD